MPLYDFVCTTTECHEKGCIIELLVKPNSKPRCEMCYSRLRKVITAPKQFILKGEGFYKPTHRKDPKTDSFEKF